MLFALFTHFVVAVSFLFVLTCVVVSYSLYTTGLVFRRAMDKLQNRLQNEMLTEDGQRRLEVTQENMNKFLAKIVNDETMNDPRIGAFGRLGKVSKHLFDTIREFEDATNIRAEAAEAAEAEVQVFARGEHEERMARLEELREYFRMLRERDEGEIGRDGEWIGANGDYIPPYDQM